MMNEARSRASSLNCHGERRDGEFGTHVIAHGPADHFAGEQVEDSQPGRASPRRSGRDIGQPDLIGPVGNEVLIPQVFRHGQECLLSVVQTR